MKFRRKVGNGPMSKRLNFGGDPDHVWIQGLFSGFVTIGRYREWLTGKEGVDPHCFFIQDKNRYGTRGHELKLYTRRSRLEL